MPSLLLNGNPARLDPNAAKDAKAKLERMLYLIERAEADPTSNERRAAVMSECRNRQYEGAMFAMRMDGLWVEDEGQAPPDAPRVCELCGEPESDDSLESVLGLASNDAVADDRLLVCNRRSCRAEF